MSAPDALGAAEALLHDLAAARHANEQRETVVMQMRATVWMGAMAAYANAMDSLNTRFLRAVAEGEPVLPLSDALLAADAEGRRLLLLLGVPLPVDAGLTLED